MQNVQTLRRHTRRPSNRFAGLNLRQYDDGGFLWSGPKSGMSMASHDLTQLARKLLALEGSGHAAGSSAGLDATARVCERLRRSLSMLAGTTGFAALLSRALAMARREAPALAAVSVSADGTLEQAIESGDTATPRRPGSEEGVALIAQFLKLLETFIGEPLTRRLVLDAWPDHARELDTPEGEGAP